VESTAANKYVIIFLIMFIVEQGSGNSLRIYAHELVCPGFDECYRAETSNIDPYFPLSLARRTGAPWNLLLNTFSLLGGTTKYSAGPMDSTLRTARYGEMFLAITVVGVRRGHVAKVASCVLLRVA